MKDSKNLILLLSSLCIALGFVVAGAFLYCGIKSISNNTRVVNVRGLSEMDVEADHVVWSLPFQELGDDLPSLYIKIGQKSESIKQFLVNNGIKGEEITLSAPQITDRLLDNYAHQQPSERYRIKTILTVSSSQVSLVRNLAARQGELLKQGIAVVSNEWDNNIEYSFTKLNEVKPQMIQDATKNAREVAVKFAEDSDSRLGKIKTASQGYFTISNVDENTPHRKHIRVVTNVEYLLKD